MCACQRSRRGAARWVVPGCGTFIVHSDDMFLTAASHCPGALTTLSRNRTAICAVLTLGGLALGQTDIARHTVAAGWWLTASLCALTLWVAARRLPRWIQSEWLPSSCLAVAIVTLAAARAVIHDAGARQRELTRIIDSQDGPQVWQFEGTVRSEPIVRRSQRGAMAAFLHHETITLLTLHVTAMTGRTWTNDGEPRERADESVSVPIDGAVLVRIEDADDRWQIGDRVAVTGIMRGFSPPLNPGEYDWRSSAQRQGLAGTLTVAHRANIRLRSHARTWPDRFLAWRARVRSCVSRWLLQDSNLEDDGPEESLLMALILGERGSGMDGIDQAFRRVGLAHVLAISGLHLGILALLVAGVCRVIGLSPQAERLAIASLVVMYVFLVPIRVPVWRAAVMLLVAMGAGLSGRRMSNLSILAVAALIVALWRPAEVFSPGFQLSFGVVSGLVLLTPTSRWRWFGPGPDDPETVPFARTTIEYAKSMITATLVAWLVSTPLVAFHFAYVCPLAPMASIPALVLVAIMLAVGFVKILTAALLPMASPILSPALGWASSNLIHMIERLDDMPGSSVAVGYPSLLWTVVALAAVVLWLGSVRSIAVGLRWRSAGVAAAGATLVVWLTAEGSHWIEDLDARPPTVRLLTVAVGNGSCHVLDPGSGSNDIVMFDCGSGDYAGAGLGLIVPALRRSGIQRVPTMIISHDDIDHYSAAVDVMREMRTQRLYVTPQMYDRAERFGRGGAAFLLARARQMGVGVQVISAGNTLDLSGDITLTCLHPNRDDQFHVDNDASAVLHIELGDAYAHRRILLTGDAQGAAVDCLRNRYPPDRLRADVMELPHHGAWANGVADALVRLVQPGLIIQSTGSARLVNDPWAAASFPFDIQRRVTARDGFITTRIHPGGDIECDGSLSVRSNEADY